LVEEDSVNSRNKGKRGERELANLLQEHLGMGITRNLAQSRDGGHDLNLDGIALEVKRREELALREWWGQTLDQAGDSRVPVLAYRASRRPWRFVLAGADLGMDWCSGYDLSQTVEVGIEVFAGWYRERFLALQ
jgi:Holliday junction resolvase